MEVALQWCSDAFRCGTPYPAAAVAAAANPRALAGSRRQHCWALLTLRLPLRPVKATAVRVAGCITRVHSAPWLSVNCSDTIIGFVNSIKTVDGGTHIDGAKAALTRTGG